MGIIRKIFKAFEVIRGGDTRREVKKLLKICECKKCRNKGTILFYGFHICPNCKEKLLEIIRK